MKDRMRKVHRIHFVGIGGVGQGGIAEVLLNLGYDVQGSDLKESAVTHRLRRMGARVDLGHDASHIGDADVVVVSSAIDPHNPEVIEARERRLPVVRRAEMLGELMRFRQGIAVSGTHGKTTTTSLIASVLAEAGEDPTFVIGGRLKSTDSNGRLGAGRFLVAEADESDASFTHLQPVMAVLTNIDADHLDTYDGDMERLREAFVEFLQNLPFYGLAIVCIDDDEARSVIGRIPCATLTYGFAKDADIRAADFQGDGIGSRFRVHRRGRADLDLRLNLPGRHNVLNALAAVAIATELELDDRALATALNSFQGIDRRLQVLGEISAADGHALVIDDYGHHPTEIAATLDAVRQGWPDRPLVVVFQPHRYSRTRDCLDDFARVLADVDRLLVTEVYAAGEEAIPGADGHAICEAVSKLGGMRPVFQASVERVPETLSDMVRGGDLVLTLGAGNIGAIAASMVSPPSAAQAGAGQ